MIALNGLTSMFSSKQHYLLGTPFYCLNFVAQRSKTGAVTISNIQYSNNSLFKDNAFLDASILRSIKGDKNVIYLTTPTSQFLYRTKIEAKMRNQGVRALIPLLKERFNIDLTQNKVAVLDAENGIEVKENTQVLPENLCIIGAQNSELKMMQNELLEYKFFPKKLCLSSLLVPGAIANYQQMSHLEKPVLVVDFSSQRSCIYIVNKKQILAAYPPTHGFKNIVTLGRKECNLPDDITTLKHLTSTIKHESEQQDILLQRFVSDIKSYINFFEVQVGLSIENFFITGLPEGLEWIEESTAKAIEVPVLKIDYNEWIKSNNIVLPKDKNINPKALFGMVSALIHYKR